MKRRRRRFGFVRPFLPTTLSRRRLRDRQKHKGSALERIESLECRTLLSATPTLTVTDAGGTFTGGPYVATVSATVNNSPIPIGQSLNFSTYLGSTSTSRAINVATDKLGNTFVVGFTTGTNFPTTSGAYETTGAADGSRSAFVAKFDPSGNLVWSTLIDGAAGFAIAVDGSDNVYVAGEAGADFQTTTGAYQTTANAGTNAFIAKLNPSGSSVLWATFLGGNAFGEVDGIAVDSAGHVYVAGDTTATNFPLKNPIQAQNNGGSDAFISELNSTGSQLVFSTYLGGSGDEFPSAIALDPAGDIFLTGTTDSPDLQTTANAVQLAYGGGESDAFVAKLNPSGAGLAYLTYLGGEADVFGSDVEMAVDAAGDAYVVGTTDADTIPMVNAYQSTYSGGQDAFIAELNPAGTAILNSTYFGSGTYASGMALDSQGNVYIAGPEFDSVPTVDPASTSGDLYVAEINLSTSMLVYSTTLGATNSGAIITPVGVTSNGNIILAGDTSSESFPTLNATQSSLTGSRDAFVTGLEPELTVSYYTGSTATGTPLPAAPSAVGTYTVVATFTSTDPNYASTQSDPVTFTISPGQPLTPNVTAFDQSGAYDGSPFTATATVLNSEGQPVSGTFAFTYYAGTSATGTGVSTAPVDAGTYTVVALFTSTDPNYADAQSVPVTFTISPATTNTSVVASAAMSVYGQSVTLTATVTSPGGTATAGTVTFYNGATPLGTSGINNGVASLPVTTITVGFDVVTATYNGDGLDFAGSSSVLSPASLIQTVAGTGVAGFNGNGIAATSAELNGPVGIVMDSQGDLFFVDSQNNEVREVNATTHVITVVAGTGVAGLSGNGIPATSAELRFPSGLAIDSEGDLYIADQGNDLVREVNASTGLISTVAGTGGEGYNGDGIAATSANLNIPDDVAVDSQGNLYIADILNNRVREVSATTGLISTIAGTGTAGYNGNGIAATSAELNLPRGVAVDAAGNVFISDSRNNLVREVVASTGDIINVAGTGTAGYNGDGIAATSAELNFPLGLAVDSSGNLFIVDDAGQRVREVSATTGLISTVAGTGVSGYNGDGIAAGSAKLFTPISVTVDSVDDVFISDSQNNRVREVASGATAITITAAIPTVTINNAGGAFTGSPLPADATVAGVVPGVDDTPGSTLEGVPLILTYYDGTDATGTPLSGPPTDIGTYTVVASFPGSQDYTSASASDTFTISAAASTPSVLVTDAGGTFTGQPYPATVSVTMNNTPIPIGQSLNFSTYLGGTGTSRAINVATDNFGNTFVTGRTNGSNFPTTTGAYETTGAADGAASAFVAKFDPSGNLVWSTLIDGAAGFAIAVDGSDNVYVAGSAHGPDFQTTTGAYQTIANASTNAFIAKLNPSGSSVIWATFLGGSDFGEVDGIAVDNSGNVYVSGDTTASDFPLKNPIQSQNNGGSEAFISELNSTGSQLVFSTYLGGSGDEFPSAIALDPAGDIFTTGTTDSPDLQTTANAFQSSYGGSDTDVFVAKLNPSGTGLAYLTYLGGSGDVTGSDVGMAVDADGDAYVTGTTDADTIPMVNAYQSTFTGGAFIAELNPSGTAIVNSTYFGSGTYASSLAMDRSGNVYVAGTTSPDSIPTVDPASTSGNLYVAEFNLSSATLVYSTYLGATDDSSIITPVGVTSNGNIILAGDTSSESFPTLNAYQSSPTGSRDAFVMGLQPELTVSYYAGTTAGGTPLAGAPSAAGIYTVVATFTSTDPNYTNAQSDPVTFTISPAGPVTPTVTAFDASGTYNGSPFAATATAEGTNGGPASGTFAFTYYVGTSATGMGTSSPPVDAGTYTVVAAFTSSDPDFTDAQSPSVTFTISPTTTRTSVSALAATESYGQSETLTATVSSTVGVPNGGTVTFFSGTTALGTQPLANGTASLMTTALPAGLDVVSATYSGDGLDFTGSTSALGPSSIIQTVAGTGVEGSNPGGIPATSANLFFPSGIAVDSAGNIFIADEQNNVVQEVNAKTGLITTIAGTGTAGYNGDGIAATSAELNFPSAVHLDAAGNIYIADSRNNRIREVNVSTGLISTVVGTGVAGYNGDGIAPISAELNSPLDIAFDSAGNLYITDWTNNRVREVSATTGLISTIAGTGTAGYNGDGIATSAELNGPDGLFVDTAGDVFVTETGGQRVREVDATTGLISTVAGIGSYGYNGDGIAATSAQLAEPEGVALDAAGNVYIAEAGNSRIREVDLATGLISTVAGSVTNGYNGDGIPADSARLLQPADVAFDTAGDLFIADLANSRVREVLTGNAVVTVTPATPTVTVSDSGGVFNGSPFAATATVAGIVPGVDNTPGSTLEGVSLTLTYYVGTTATGTPLSGAPIAAGTYTVVASFPGSQDYSSAGDSATFSISQALPVISVSDAGGIFNGSAFPATATIAGIVSGVDNTAGSSLEGVPLTLTYYAGISPTGTPLPGPPTNAGSYTVEASFAGSTDYLSFGKLYSFVIFQATPVFTVSDAGGTFNGNPFPGTGTVAGVVAGVDNTPGSSLEGVNLTLLYFAGETIGGTPLSGPPSTGGSYAIEAYFPGSQDYAVAGKGFFFVISQATPVLSVSDTSGTYSGHPFAATSSVAGVVTGVDNTPGNSLEGVNLTVAYYAGNNITGTPLSGPPTDAGFYTALASFAGSTDYRPTSDADVFTISQATPSVTLTDAGGPANGNSYPATAKAAGIGGTAVSGSFTFTYYVGSTVNGSGSSTPPSTPGTYTVTAAFTSGNPDYSNASGGPVTFTISHAAPAVSAPSSATLYQNGSLTFSTANGNAISVSDSAASGTSDSITLSVTRGVLKFVTTTGLKFTSGSNNSASMTVNGTLANLNADLQTLKYTPTSGYNGPDAINIKAADAADGLSSTVTVNLTVFGPPILTAPSTANVNENAALVFSNSNGNAATLTDAAARATSDSLTLTVTHGTLSLGSTAGLTFTAGSNNSTTMTVTGTLSSLQAALSGLTYTPTTSYAGAASLTVKVKDSASGFNATATVAITVVVPASQPTVTVSTQIPTSVPGEPVPFVITVSDTNSVANSAGFSLSIAFGDGKSAKVSSSNALIVNHVYTKTGTYTVSVTATDEYGHVSTAATTTIHVVAAAIEINPFNPSQTALFVGGTTSKDTVTFTASGNQIAVTLNKVNEGTFSTSGPLIVFGQGGADVINVGAGLTNSSYLLESPNADNAETDLDNAAIQWAGLTSAVEILNE